jgi:uncharacterized protein
VVTNVANFGAFVDIGVHQDGLVHVSALSHRFVKDPREVVKAGDAVRVKVLEIDLKRNRIALTLRLDDEAGAAPSGARPAASPSAARPDRPRHDAAAGGRAGGREGGPNTRRDQRGSSAPATAMAAAFSKLRK